MLFPIIRKNKKLAAKRNPAFDTNRFAKFLIYFMIAYWAALLIFMGVMLPMAFEGSFPTMEPYHILNKGLIYILLADVLLRIMAEPPMSQELKPYLLLPVKKNVLINSFLLQKGTSSYNFLWFFFFVPFAFITIIKFYGFLGIFTYLIGIWLLIILNAYWFTFCKILYDEHQYLIIVPIITYALIAFLEFGIPGHYISMFTMNLGEKFIEGNIIYYLIVLLGILFMFWLCGKIQLHYLYDEISKKQDSKLKHVSQYKFLDKYGLVGDYMRLELKLYTRNKTAKKQFVSAFIFMLIFVFALAFSNVYDGQGMQSYISFYTFCVLGVMMLGQVMCYEGNYIDGLMSRKESIYTLLRAKYYINCLFVIIPFVVMLVPVFKDKMPFIGPVAYALFTMGFVFALLLQLAVYNNRTLPLNASIMKSNKANSPIQMVVTLSAFLIPFLVDIFLKTILGQNGAFIIESIVGLGFIITHRFWIKNIYNRLMKRRYQNMEGFRATR